MVTLVIQNSTQPDKFRLKGVLAKPLCLYINSAKISNKKHILHSFYCNLKYYMYFLELNRLYHIRWISTIFFYTVGLCGEMYKQWLNSIEKYL